MRRLILASIKFFFTLLFVVGIFNFSWGQNLCISQYIETTSGISPKGIEVFNNTGADIDLSSTNLKVYQGTNGGGCSSKVTISSGILKNGEVWVIGTSDLTSYANTNGTNLSGTKTYGFAFNGDDALELYLGASLQDVIGTCGSDPGSSWSGSGVSTANQNLQIKSGICSGTTSYWTDPSLRYDNIAGGTVMTGFGNAPTCISCSAPTTQASAISFSSVDHSSMTISWTNGNGSNRVVKINTTNSFTAPADGTDPSANSTYGGSGEQVVYNGSSNSVTVDGLSPGTTYWFRVYEYNCTGSNTVYLTSTATSNPNSQVTTTCSAPTTEASTMTFSSVGSSSMTVSWTSGNGNNRIVVIHQGSAVTSNPVNGTSYSASSTYGSGDDIGTNEFVIYDGTGNSVTVNGLSASTTYYFKIFEFNCSGGNEVYLTTSPLSGNQTTTAVPVPAVLTQGDIVVVGICSNIAACISGTSGGDDEISFVCFKDITTGTEIDMTDNGWERCHTGQWGNAEGFLRIKRTGGTIIAGTVITFRTHGSGTEFEGVYPDNSWSITTSGGFARLILNADGDQIYFMQGGTWSDGTSGNNDATYTGGDVLFGFNTNDTWTSGICSTSNSSSGNGRSQNSGLYDSMDCFNMVPNAATDYLKYTGPITPTSQIAWVGRINDNTNWSSYSDCATYYAGSPDYTNGDTLQITATGLTATYQWYGNKDTQWFECANWGPLRVPTASDDVIIPNSHQVDNDIVLNTGENAECDDFTVEHPTYTIKGENGATKVLTVNGNIIINGGSIDFDDGNAITTDGTIYLKGNWTNNNATTDFLRGNSTVIFNGNTTQTITSNVGTENFGNVQITGSSVLNLNGNDLEVFGNWTNYNQSGLTEGTSTITFNGTSNQNINTTGGEVIYNVVVDNPTTVTLSNNLTVTNQLNQAQGELVINGKTLTLQNDLIRASGTFTGSNSSNMIINGSGNLATALYFTSGSQSLNNLTVNRSSSGTVTMATNLTIYGVLSMSAGELAINGQVLTLNGTVSGIGTLKGSANSELYIGGSGNLGTMYFSAGAQEVKNLTTNRSSGISTLGTDLTVNTLLTLTNGLITTGANNLVVSTTNAAAVTGQNTNSYVNGNLRRAFASNTDTYAFPLGTSTIYTLAEVVNNNLVGISYIDSKFLTSFSNTGSLDPAKAIDFGTPYTSISPEGIWYLEPDVQPTGGDYTIKLHFDDGGGTNAFSGLSDNKFGPLKRDVSSTSAFDWSALNGNLNPNGGAGRMVADGYAQRNGITSFSHFAIGRADFALPVELLRFTVTPQNNTVKLDWTTASEINNNYFSIERSKDAVNFEQIQTIQGAGNSRILLEYSAFDFHPLFGKSYYRLRQTDFDGKSTVSKMVSVDFSSENNTVNYTVQNDFLTVTSNQGMPVSVSVYDVTGKLLIQKDSNGGFLRIPLGALTTHQLYFLKIQSTDTIVADKFFR
ncbi:MAG: hypothetical protein J7L46_06660 [Bacteroidales bacterium]|nr:hypothetical protein [Bacteroidales bacterium]